MATAGTLDRLDRSNATRYDEHTSHRHCDRESSASAASAQPYGSNSWSSAFHEVVHAHSTDTHSQPRCTVVMNYSVTTMQSPQNHDRPSCTVPDEKVGSSMAVDLTEQPQQQLPLLLALQASVKWCS